MMREKIEDNLKVVNFILIALLIVFIAHLLSGGKTSSTPVETVAEKVTAAADLTNVTQADSQKLKKYYGLNANDYEGVAFYLVNSNMDVDEILIVRMKDSAQENALKDAMQTRIDTQTQSFEGYGVNQTKLLKDAVIDVKGNYALLVVNEKAAEADEAFRKSL
jgi:uncharacterized protein YpmB